MIESQGRHTMGGTLMKILAIEQETPGRHPDSSGEQFKPHLKAEAARAWELYQAGVFRELYFNRDRRSAVLMLECADVEQEHQVLNTLPPVQAGLIAFDSSR